MHAYLAIKFHEDFCNKQLIEEISDALREAGVSTTIMARDFEKWGSVKFEPQELMEKTFEEIDKSDLLVIEFSEKGVGLGIEAGYAYAKNIPIIVIAKNDSDISDTLKGIAKHVLFYDSPEELADKIKELNLI